MLHQSNASQDAKKDDLRHEKDDEVEKNDIPLDVNIGMEASRNLQLAEKHMTKELKDDYSNDDSVIDIAKLFGTPTISDEFSHPFTDPTKRKKLRKEIEEPLTLFDPLRPTSEEALESFRKWMSNDQGSTIDIDYMHIDKKWFQSLSNHGSWLPDTHINVAFFFFRKRRIENPHMFSQKLTTMDIMFWQNARVRWIKYDKKWNQFKLPENDILIDYANGSQPLYYVKWTDVDIVHVPSMFGLVIGFYGDTKVNYYEWEIERLQDIPQQEHAGDCDMFIIKYVEYLMHNHPLKSLTSARMD
ncbi:hypothetical protein CK203_101032 [Vitis vinifera]|uniref:Ubiquitin-like protease family profile domain-containing protein n=1 Tax=Vitis vinifera TaxID=29760 RepID=A0A438FI83_VITVI|nr:hypothetical protein CK203_101032 [Vitis vinifera]